jgi:uncharacterized membrane protein YsdA (DUF1294 family)
MRAVAVRSAPPLPGYLVVAGFALLCAAAMLLWRLPAWVPAVYVALSLITAVVYAVDKRAARVGTRRVSENALHLLAISGGWPGAVVAQQRLRHKTAKRSFRRVFWLTVAANVLVFAALATPAAALVAG